MTCRGSHPLVLTPILLGRDGVLRAYTLVSPDRPGLTLEAWLAETAADAPRRDRLLTDGAGEALPPRGLVGLTAPTGCLFAVFAYAVETGDPARLAVRGPSWSAPMGGRLVPDGIDATLLRLADDLDCPEIRRSSW